MTSIEDFIKAFKNPFYQQLFHILLDKILKFIIQIPSAGKFNNVHSILEPIITSSLPHLLGEIRHETDDFRFDAYFTIIMNTIFDLLSSHYLHYSS